MAAGATVTNNYAAHVHAKSTWSQLEHKTAQVSGVAAVNLLESAISSSPRMAKTHHRRPTSKPSTTQVGKESPRTRRRRLPRERTIQLP